MGYAHAPAIEMTQAWVRYQNERGGLNGHPIEFLVADDGGDVARHQALVREMVEKRKVIAFLMNFEAIGGEQSADYLASKRIPVVGSVLGENFVYGRPTYFPQAAAGDAMWESSVAALAQVVVPAGKTKLGLFGCAEVAACQIGVDAASKFAKSVGLEVVYKGKLSIAQPDYTSECLALRNAGAQLMWAVMEALSYKRFASSCVRQNYKPTYSVAGQGVTAEMLADNNLDRDRRRCFYVLAVDARPGCRRVPGGGRQIPSRKADGHVPHHGLDGSQAV